MILNSAVDPLTSKTSPSLLSCTPARVNSADKDTPANFGIGMMSPATLNSVTTVFDPGGDKSDSEWAERSAHASADANS
ncbi:hypothetical protein PC129_g3178 [Phytophthora cactorum]|uniref:Uncharacterized protein n=1 Tax=Phytophthora cactorum TaxID=29920 RepID=A0A8T1IPM4_9STRA|nr:hypothetical protein Pcac1_g5554 [Phytophthora cactorum]KAG3226221.1 hypothetical protein PC129_g3178 [Phytophthora cactorum]